MNRCMVMKSAVEEVFSLPGCKKKEEKTSMNAAIKMSKT